MMKTINLARFESKDGEDTLRSLNICYLKHIKMKILLK